MKILFVCLGNICRSPTAEAVFRKKFKEHNIAATFDSAGTANYHAGERSDPRTIEHGEARGYAMTHIARQVKINDFIKFDLVFAMDRSNFKNLELLGLDQHARSKLKMVTELTSHILEIPDPYYGGKKDFELVIDLLERCADAWIEKIKAEKQIQI